MDKKDAHRRERKMKHYPRPFVSFYFSFYFCNGFHDNLCYNPQDQKMSEQDLVLFISGA